MWKMDSVFELVNLLSRLLKLGGNELALNYHQRNLCSALVSVTHYNAIRVHMLCSLYIFVFICCAASVLNLCP